MTLQAFLLILSENHGTRLECNTFLANKTEKVWHFKRFCWFVLWKSLILYNALCFFMCFGRIWAKVWECCSQMMLWEWFFGTHPWNPRNPRNPQNRRKWCHEVRFRCLLPRAPVGQDDGSLSKLPQTITKPCGHQSKPTMIPNQVPTVACYCVGVWN